MKMRFRCTDCDHHCTIEVKYEAGEATSEQLIRVFREDMCKIFNS